MCQCCIVCCKVQEKVEEGSWVSTDWLHTIPHLAYHIRAEAGNCTYSNVTRLNQVCIQR